MPRNSGWVRNDWSHPLGEVPCRIVGPACAVAVAESASAVMTSRNLFSSTVPTVEVPFRTEPSRTHCLRSGVAAQATYAV